MIDMQSRRLAARHKGKPADMTAHTAHTMDRVLDTSTNPICFANPQFV